MFLRTVERFRLVFVVKSVVSRFEALSSEIGLVVTGSELDDDWLLATVFSEKGLFGCKKPGKSVLFVFDWLAMFFRFLSDVLLTRPCRTIREVKGFVAGVWVLVWLDNCVSRRFSWSCRSLICCFNCCIDGDL